MSTLHQQASSNFYLAPLSVFAAILSVLLILLVLPFLVNRLRRCPAVDRLFNTLSNWICPALYVPPTTTLLRPMSSEGLKSLKVTQFQHGAKHGDWEIAEPDVCAICLSEFIKQQPIVTLPCGHYFHQECLLTWLQRDASCPMCKANLEPKLDNNTPSNCETPQQQQEQQQQQQQAAALSSSTSAVMAAALPTAAASLQSPPQPAVTLNQGVSAAAVACAPSPLHIVVS